MKKAILGGVIATVIGITGYIQYASQYPEVVSNDVVLRAAGIEEEVAKKVVGDTTTAALIYSVETLMNKPGGYQSNDILVKMKLYDNMPNFEKGVIFMARDLANAMRLEMSRSQSQSIEDPSLKVATPNLNFDTDSWFLPSTESRYSDGTKGFRDYLKRITDPTDRNAQFYARADNLTYWLDLVSKRLGSYSQRLSASIDRERLNTDLAGDSNAEQSTVSNQSVEVKTDWMLIDDTFWEARGGCWALIQYLRAVEEDFASVLEDKNALVSLRQVIRELEGTQQTMWSPMVFNGAPFGIVGNHSLSMANYISRANAAIIDLRDLLNRG
ncbi:DUF2333 family protein [Vibrio owensii]|uniref:DUF2333 family protein n=1 Tax=Vibrio owensii TaxID=696485 RepID=UPI003CC6C7FB